MWVVCLHTTSTSHSFLWGRPRLNEEGRPLRDFVSHTGFELLLRGVNDKAEENLVAEHPRFCPCFSLTIWKIQCLIRRMVTFSRRTLRKLKSNA